MDVHVPAAITRGLLLRGVDVLTAQLDGSAQLEDPDLLNRATELGRVLFSQDEDLLAEATKRQRRGTRFGGVIYAHQLGITIGRAINDLEIRFSRKPERWRTSRIEWNTCRSDGRLGWLRMSENQNRPPMERRHRVPCVGGRGRDAGSTMSSALVSPHPHRWSQCFDLNGVRIR